MKQHKLADVKMTCMNSRQTHGKISINNRSKRNTMFCNYNVLYMPGLKENILTFVLGVCSPV